MLTRQFQVAVPPRFMLVPDVRNHLAAGCESERLVRRLCQVCHQPKRAGETAVAQGSVRIWEPVGCPQCAGTGYQGRLLLAEMLTLQQPLRRAILARSDTASLEAAVVDLCRETIWTAAQRAVQDGYTTPEEIERVMGLESS